MILSLVAVLDGGIVEPETRVECPLPIEPDGDMDVVIVAEIRRGHVTLHWHYGVGLNQPASRENASTTTLRAALVGLVGVDGRTDLEAMEVVMRAMPAPSEDIAASVNAVHALLATLPE